MKRKRENRASAPVVRLSRCSREERAVVAKRVFCLFFFFRLQSLSLASVEYNGESVVEFKPTTRSNFIAGRFFLKSDIFVFRVCIFKKTGLSLFLHRANKNPAGLFAVRLAADHLSISFSKSSTSTIFPKSLSFSSSVSLSSFSSSFTSSSSSSSRTF